MKERGKDLVGQTTKGLFLLQSSQSAQINIKMADQALSPEKSATILEEILQLDGNKLCADCGASRPRWAVYNLGRVGMTETRFSIE